MFKYWTGPAVVVAHLTDEELPVLLDRLDRCPALQNRTAYLALHLVYKRHVSSGLIHTGRARATQTNGTC